MKKAIQIVLFLLIIVLGYLLINSFVKPVKFQQTVKLREVAVIDRIKDIRTAQRAYKQMYQRFSPSFDSLIHFVLNDSLTFERQIGSADDSVAVAKGLVRREKFNIAVIDTIFGDRILTPEQVQQFRFVPFGKGQEYIMFAGNLTTESKVVVPVFECRAPYKVFLSDLDDQMLVNLIDDAHTLNKYPGIKVGSMTEATNEAGNWE